jgi:hypothetical protein
MRRLGDGAESRPVVIVISAGSISLKRIEELRPDRHLEKPFPMDALLRILAELAVDQDGPPGPTEGGHLAESSGAAADDNESS